MTKSPFTKTIERASDLLGLIHFDVCGPLSVQARGGYSYFVTFTDDLSRYGCRDFYDTNHHMAAAEYN